VCLPKKRERRKEKLNKKALWISLAFLALLMIASFPSAAAVHISIPNQGHYIVESIGDPETVDPRWAYDTASGTIIFQVYEPLIQFGSYPVNPPASTPKGFPEAVEEFRPALASSWRVDTLAGDWMVNTTVVNLANPIGSHWACKAHGGDYVVTGWFDRSPSPPDGKLSKSDYLWLHTITPAATHPEVASETFRYHMTADPKWASPSVEIDLERYTYVFKLRTSPTPTFSNGATVTTEDVEYSFESWMVQDRSGGPEWMIFEPTMGIGIWHATDIYPVANREEEMDYAIEHNATHVWINLAQAYPPFLSILAQTWASILNEAWCISKNDWPHTWANWMSYHDPAHSPLDSPTNVMMGTGPYMLDYWTHGVEWSVVRNPNHWGGWPSSYGSRYFDRITEKVVYEWGTRYADFVAGTADTVYVPRQYIPQLITNWPVPAGQWEKYATGTRCLKDLPQLAVDGIFFNFDINPASTYVGSGQLDGNGIPLDFFSDLNIRKAFAHIFDYKNYLKDVYLGEAEAPPSPHIKGLAYADYIWNGGTLPNGTVLDGNATQAGIQGIPRYWLDWAKAKQYFIDASNTVGGPAQGVTTKGFKMTITYNSGNQPRQVACQIYKTNVEKLFSDNGWGPVTITVTSVSWPTYLGEIWFRPLYTSVMGIYMIGWLVDFPDPHNFVGPFQYSAGDFAAPSSYYNAEVDALIEAGIVETDLANARPYIYWKIAEKYWEDIPSICDVQALGRRWERDWVQGWYYNAIYPGMYPYHLWKGLNGDINGDNKVNILDAGKVSAHWFTPPAPAGPSGYDTKSDVSPYLQFMGKSPPVTKLPKDPATGNPAPSIGRVDIMDAAVINAHWLEETP